MGSFTFTCRRVQTFGKTIEAATVEEARAKLEQMITDETDEWVHRLESVEPDYSEIEVDEAVQCDDTGEMLEIEPMSFC